MLGRARWLLTPALLAAAFAVLPEAGLACADPVLRSMSPDGRHSLTVCRGWLPFAMPGQGGDAPGAVVLRDAAGHVCGAVALGAVNEIGHPPEWGAGRAAIPLVADFAVPDAQPGPLRAWLADRTWRLRNLAWLLPRSEAFR